MLNASTKRFSVAAAAVKGVRWNYIGSLFSVTCSLTVTAMLARILGPGPFGEAMVASTIYGLANLFVNGGFSQALVQQEDLPSLQIRRAFTTQVVLGMAFTLTVILFAPFIARSFHTAQATPVIRVMAFIITIQAFGLVSAALLRRDMRFSVVQHANICGYVAGYILVALPLAYHGAGVWSLVAAYLTQALTTSVYVYIAVRHPIKPSFHLPNRSILHFGGAITGSNLVNWGHSNLDNVASSRLGPGYLGLYGRACNLAYQPVTAVVTIAQPVLLATSAKIQSRPALLKRLLLATLAVMFGLVCPAYIALACIPSTVIIGLYGPKWVSAVPLMVPMALAMPMWGAMAICGPVLAGVGKPHVEFWGQAITCAMAAAAFFTASRFSLLTIAWMLLCVSGVRFVVILWVTFRALDIPISQAGAIIAERLCVAVPFGIIVFAGDRLLRSRYVNYGMCLAFDAALACLLLATVVWVFPRAAFGYEAIDLLREHALHLPVAYRSKILKRC